MPDYENEISNPNGIPPLIDPTAGFGASMPPIGGGIVLGQTCATYNGVITRAGGSKLLSDLLNLSVADLVLIQHKYGTGQIRMGKPVTPPPIYSQNFYSLALGDLGGQDGWVASPAIPGINSLSVQDTPRGRVLEDLGDHTPGGGFTVYDRVATGSVPLGSPFEYRMKVYFAGGGHGADEIICGLSPAGASYFNPQFSIYVRADGTMTFNAAAFSVTATGVIGAVNLIQAVTDSAGNVSFYLNSVLVGTAPMLLPALPTTDMYMLTQSFFPINVPDLMEILDIEWWNVTVGTTGLLFPDGGGERLTGGLFPVPLKQIALSVDGAALADATVEIFAIGSM